MRPTPTSLVLPAARVAVAAGLALGVLLSPLGCDDPASTDDAGSPSADGSPGDVLAVDVAPDLSAPEDQAGDLGVGADAGVDAPGAPDAGPAEALPTPVALMACDVVEAGMLPPNVDESSALAALPGVVGANGRELLVTHGDAGLTLDFVDPSGERDGRLKIIDAGDFEAVTVVSIAHKGAIHHLELAALESPGNQCTRGEGGCTDGHIVRISVAAQPGSYVLLSEPTLWALPPKERTNAECLEQVGPDLLLFAKNTADKYRVHLQDGATTAVLEALVREKKTDAQGKLTDLTHDPDSGRLFATSTSSGAAILVEIDPLTWEPIHVTPIPAPLSFEKVEGIAVLEDETIVLTSEAGSIRRYACR